MKVITQLFLLLGLFLIVWSCDSIAENKSLQKQSDTEEIELRGIVSVRGHEPFTYLVIKTGDQKLYRITGPFMETLWQKHQDKYVQIRGRITLEEVSHGPSNIFFATKIIKSSN